MIQPLSNATHVEGTYFSLVCNVSGSPLPTVTWTSIQTGNRSEGNALNFTNVDRTQDVEYVCEASNQCGNDSKSTFVIVHCEYCRIHMYSRPYLLNGNVSIESSAVSVNEFATSKLHGVLSTTKKAAEHNYRILLLEFSLRLDA